MGVRHHWLGGGCFGLLIWVSLGVLIGGTTTSGVALQIRGLAFAKVGSFLGFWVEKVVGGV